MAEPEDPEDVGAGKKKSVGTGPDGPSSGTGEARHQIPPPESGDRAQAVLRLVDGAPLFMSQTGEPFVVWPHAGRVESLPINGDQFSALLRSRYFEQTKRVLRGPVLKEAVATLASQCVAARKNERVHVRVAGDQQVVYFDLANAEGQALKVTATGTDVITNPPVRFFRPHLLLPLQQPKPGGRVEDLGRFVNVRPEDVPLLICWMLAAMRPNGPYPLLVLSGPQGSAKSTTAKVVRALIDPHKIDARGDVASLRDLMVAAQHTWVLAFDNLSRMPDWLSDGLCRLASGASFATRALYTNAQEHAFVSEQPCIINGIRDLVRRPDLLERSIILTLPAIDPSLRRTERDIWAEFEEARPRLLGALAEALSGALKAFPEVSPPAMPRMADFAKWASACERGLGWPRGTFWTAYARNQDEASAQALESSPIFLPLRKLLDEYDEWTGTATELGRQLASRLDNETGPHQRWLRKANAVSGALRDIEADLLRMGIVVERSRDPKTRARLITLRVTNRQTEADTDAGGPAEVDNADPLGPNDADDANDVSPGLEARDASALTPSRASDDPNDADEGLDVSDPTYDYEDRDPVWGDDAGVS